MLQRLCCSIWLQSPSQNLWHQRPFLWLWPCLFQVFFPFKPVFGFSFLWLNSYILFWLPNIFSNLKRVYCLGCHVFIHSSPKIPMRKLFQWSKILIFQAFSSWYVLVLVGFFMVLMYSYLFIYLNEKSWSIPYGRIIICGHDLMPACPCKGSRPANRSLRTVYHCSRWSFHRLNKTQLAIT